MNAQTTIVSVCHNSEAILPQMLQSIPNGIPIILIDNASIDSSAFAQIALAHGAKVVTNSQNLGFGNACNQGAAKVNTPFVMFLNPDAMLGENCLKILENAAQKLPEASAFNPLFVDRKGNTSFRRKSPLAPDQAFNGPPPNQPSEIPVLMGSAIFVRKATFDQIGGFDSNIFLYHEDDDLSLRLQKLGPLMRIPAASVTHLEGRSSARTPQSAAFKAYHMARSKVYALTKHGHHQAGRQVLMQSILALLSPLMLSTRKRAKAIGFLKGALSASKDGGRGHG